MRDTVANSDVELLASYLEIGTMPSPGLDVLSSSSFYSRGICVRHGRSGDWGTLYNLLQCKTTYQALNSGQIRSKDADRYTSPSPITSTYSL